jgi:DNA-binding transcriptional ArsR family regulator
MWSTAIGQKHTSELIRHTTLTIVEKTLYRASTINDGISAMSFSAADEQLAAQLKAMAHPARLQILELLADRGQCVCGEIVNVLPLAQSTVSQHLKILKEAGLLVGTIDGPRSCYCLDGQALVAFRRAFTERLAGLETREKPQGG